MFLARASYGLAAAGSIGTGAALIHAGGDSRVLLSRFALWALLPYAVLATAGALARRRGISIAIFSRRFGRVALRRFRLR